MNAAIRAVVRSSFYYGVKVCGIYRGYEGMIEGDICDDMDVRSVNHILQRGGTVLKSARSKEFMTKEGRAKAYEVLKNAGIDALVANAMAEMAAKADEHGKEFDADVAAAKIAERFKNVRPEGKGFAKGSKK